MNPSDSEIESCDEETEIHEIEQLTAVLESDKTAPSDVISCSFLRSGTSICSNNERGVTIESVIALNKITDDKLCKLEKMLIERLKQCRLRLSEIQSTTPPTKERPEKFCYSHCGQPYFKDKNFFPAPDNEDTILMKKLNMVDFSKISSIPGWSVKDKSDFITIIEELSMKLRKNSIQSELSQLLRKAKKNRSESLIKSIQEAEFKLDSVSKLCLDDIVLPIDEEYDWDYVASQLNNRHEPEEYRALWRLFLHPSINKDAWSKDEHRNLETIATEYGFQDWDTIAKTLKTSRSGYQCFVYYRTNLNDKLMGRKWYADEIEYLKRLIEFYKEDSYIPWGKIAASMENRTKMQVYNKYFRLLVNRKGRFLPEEDAVILTCIKQFGLNFKLISEHLPGRSYHQVRNRYNLISKLKLSSVWSVQDDKRLIQIVANQDSPVNFALITKYFPGKSRTHIRSRYMTLSKWMKRNPHRDILYAPRRGPRRLGHGKGIENLDQALEKLKLRMQSEVETKKSERLSVNSPDDDIDDAIIAILVNERFCEIQESVDDEQYVFLTNDNLLTKYTLNVVNLHRLLIFLNAKLSFPCFENSVYHELYPELTTLKISLTRLKCYSAETNVDLNDSPDIWGNSTDNFTNTLPPHFATITGCKALMNITKFAKDIKSINPLIKKNSLLKANLQKLMSRFDLLFIWPLLLSNEGIPEYNPYKPYPKVFPTLSLPGDPGVAIPIYPKKQYNSSKKTVKSIDLKMTNNKTNNIEKVNIKENNLEGCSYTY